MTVAGGDEVNAHLLGAGNDESAKVGKPGCRRGLGERRQIFIGPRCIVVEKLMNVVVGGEVIDILEVANIKSSHAVTRGRDRTSGNCCQIRVLPIGPIGGEELVNVGVDTGVVDVQGGGGGERNQVASQIGDRGSARGNGQIGVNPAGVVIEHLVNASVAADVENVLNIGHGKTADSAVFAKVNRLFQIQVGPV